MQISCGCEVSRNGFQDPEIKNKDRNKVLQVFKMTNGEEGAPGELKMMIKYQRSMDLAIEFSLKDISTIYN
jgi:hypothetical protein